MNSWPRVVVSITLACLVSLISSAQTTRAVTDKVDLPGSTEQDFFGIGIAIDGERVLIASDEETYLYEPVAGEWRRTATIPRESSGSGGIDLSGNTALIDNKVWVETAPGSFVLEAELPCPRRDLSRGVIDGDMVALSCRVVPHQYPFYVVQVYRRTAGVWSSLEEIIFEDSGTLEVIEPRVFVGRTRNDPFGISNAGSVDVFVYAADGSWSYEDELVAANAAEGYHFGYPLHSDGQNLIVYGENEVEDGAVYFFELVGGTWVQDPRIHRLDKGIYDPRLAGDRISVLSTTTPYNMWQPCRSSGGQNCELVVFARQGDGTWTQESSAPLGWNFYAQGIGGGSTFASKIGEGYHVGEVRRFDQTTGLQVQLIEPDPATSPTFHDIRELAASGERLVVRGQATTDFGYRVLRPTGSAWQLIGEFDDPGGDGDDRNMAMWGPRLAADGQLRIFKEGPQGWNGAEESIDVTRDLTGLSLFADSVSFAGFRGSGNHTEGRFFNGSSWSNQTPINAVGYSVLSQSGPRLASVVGNSASRSVKLSIDELHPAGARDTGTWTNLSAAILALPFDFGTTGCCRADADFSGERVLVGFARAAHPWPFSGAAVVLADTPTGWVVEADLTPAWADTEDHFGAVVQLVGDTAIVAAPDSDLAAPGAGAVYVFRRSGSTWSLADILVAADAKPSDAFGTSVVAWGSRIAIAAPYADGLGADSGAVYVLRDPSLFATQISARLGGVNDEIFFDVLGQDDGSVVAGTIGSWGAGGAEGLIATYDHHGAKTAGMSFGGAADDRFEGLAEATDGSLYAAGSQSSWGNGGTEAWLVKADAGLVKQWQRSVGGAGDEGYAAVAATADSGAVAVGWVESWGPGQRSGLIHRYGPGGAILWGSSRGGAADDELRDVIVNSGGNIVTVGRQSSWGAAGSNGWLMVFDGNGNQGINKSFGSDFDDGLEAITELEGGGYVAVGWRGLADGTTQGWYLRFDAAFNLLSSVNHGAQGTDDRFNDVFEVAGQAVYAVGSWVTSAGDTNAWFTVLSLRDGSMLIERHPGNDFDEAFEAIARSGFDGLILAGSQGSWSLGGQDAWLKAADWDGSW